MRLDVPTFVFMTVIGVVSSLAAIVIAERMAARREQPKPLPTPVAPGAGTA